MKSIASFQADAHANARAKGFWEKFEVHESVTGKILISISPLEQAGMLMLMVSELAEAMESIRRDEPPVWQECGIAGQKVLPSDAYWNPNQKPEGALTELADVVIRVMDFCGAMGWDLESAIAQKILFNASRSHKHGGKAF